MTRYELVQIFTAINVVVVAYEGEANTGIWSKCVSQYCIFHSF